MSFAEHRSDDAIVVYPGPGGFVARYLPYGEFDDAATVVIKYLNTDKVPATPVSGLKRQVEALRRGKA